jgi:glycosyltransferase involved in cell wall biosynthesis
MKLFNVERGAFHWIPNAVDIESFKTKLEDENTSYVIYIGSLIPRKGLYLLSKIAEIVTKKLPTVVFLIIGEGPLKKKLIIESKKFKGKMKVLGRVSNEDLQKWLSISSLLILPSYSEGLPTVCLEALASETPVVASNVGGISEIIINNETGFLVAPGEVKIFAEKVIELLNEPETRKYMGMKGRKMIKKYYTWDKVVEKTIEIYEDISKNR